MPHQEAPPTPTCCWILVRTSPLRNGSGLARPSAGASRASRSRLQLGAGPRPCPTCATDGYLTQRR